jgi:hypothetical protein
MRFLLKFTDRPRYELRRLTLALAELCRSAAASDTDSKSRFLRFSQAVTGARRLMKRGGPGRTELLAALETAGVRLEKAFLDMSLYGLKPDAESAEALIFIAGALRLQAEFIARPAEGTFLPEAAKHIASASRGLLLARRAAKADTGDFIPNLKFCTIYEDLEKTVIAVGDYAELLARTLSPLI